MKAWIIFIFGLFVSTLVNAGVSIEPYKIQEFNPSSGKIFELPIKITEPGKIEVSLYTADGDLVRTLSDGKQEKAGVYPITWDGKDQNKVIVPNEAYTPVVKLVNDKTTHIYDSRKTSGGEEIKINP
ncbi:MAG: FlgD immunoglobulin-like domain containing protein, partial [Pseudomonadota bacterium]